MVTPSVISQENMGITTIIIEKREINCLIQTRMETKATAMLITESRDNKETSSRMQDTLRRAFFQVTQTTSRQAITE